MTMRTALALWMAAACNLALAHSAPQSIVKLEFMPHSVRAEILVPESELAFATAAETTPQPFAQYLLRHMSAETPLGAAWKVEVRSVRDTTYLEHAYLLTEVVMTPPAGASARELVLVDDAVTHEVRNHIIAVLTRTTEGLHLLGVLQYPARRLQITRLKVTGFRTRVQNSH